MRENSLIPPPLIGPCASLKRYEKKYTPQCPISKILFDECQRFKNSRFWLVFAIFILQVITFKQVQGKAKLAK